MTILAAPEMIRARCPSRKGSAPIWWRAFGRKSQRVLTIRPHDGKRRWTACWKGWIRNDPCRPGRRLAGRGGFAGGSRRKVGPVDWHGRAGLYNEKQESLLTRHISPGVALLPAPMVAGEANPCRCLR